LKMKLKGLHFADVAEIQEAVTDELQKVQTEVFSAVFQKLYDRAKACIYANGAYFELKRKVRVFLTCLRFLKKSLDRTVYVPQCLTLHNSTFCPHGAFMCFVWISEQIAIIYL